METKEGEWLASAPRCARCGQPYLPVPAEGHYACGRCGRPLSPGDPGATRGALRQWAGLARLLAPAALVVLLALAVLRMMPMGGAERQSSSVQPPPFAGAWSPPGPGGAPGWGAVGASGGSLSVPDLERGVTVLQALPPRVRDTYFRNLELGNRCFLLARGIVRASAPPQRPDAGPRRRSKDPWLAGMRARLASDRAIASTPNARRWLDDARAAYERALALAATGEQRRRVHQWLADVLCVSGESAAALRHLEQAGDRRSEDSRSLRIRVRCLVGLGRVAEARKLGGYPVGAPEPAVGPMGMPGMAARPMPGTMGGPMMPGPMGGPMMPGHMGGPGMPGPMGGQGMPGGGGGGTTPGPRMPGPTGAPGAPARR